MYKMVIMGYKFTQRVLKIPSYKNLYLFDGAQLIRPLNRRLLARCLIFRMNNLFDQRTKHGVIKIRKLRYSQARHLA